MWSHVGGLKGHTTTYEQRLFFFEERYFNIQDMEWDVVWVLKGDKSPTMSFFGNKYGNMFTFLRLFLMLWCSVKEDPLTYPFMVRRKGLPNNIDSTFRHRKESTSSRVLLSCFNILSLCRQGFTYVTRIFFFRGESENSYPLNVGKHMLSFKFHASFNNRSLHRQGREHP